MSLPPVIVGGGPAGMAAAVELARHGVSSVLFEEASRLGGVVYRGPLRSGVDLGYLGARYSATLEKLHGEFATCADRVDVRCNTRIVGGEGARTLMALNACGHFRTGILTSAITGVMLERLVHQQPLPLDITPFLADRFDFADGLAQRRQIAVSTR